MENQPDPYLIIKKCLVLSRETPESCAEYIGITKNTFSKYMSKRTLDEGKQNQLIKKFVREGVYNYEHYVLSEYSTRKEYMTKLRKFCGYSQKEMALQINICPFDYRKKELTGIITTKDRDELLKIATINNLSIEGEEPLLLSE